MPNLLQINLFGELIQKIHWDVFKSAWNKVSYAHQDTIYLIQIQ